MHRCKNYCAKLTQSEGEAAMLFADVAMAL